MLTVLKLRSQVRKGQVSKMLTVLSIFLIYLESLHITKAKSKQINIAENKLLLVFR
jgi:hypothetical protein